jgi:hypothetical protein
MASGSESDAFSDLSISMECDSFSFDEGSEEEDVEAAAEQPASGLGINPYMYEPRRPRRHDRAEAEVEENGGGGELGASRREQFDW